MEKTIVLTLNDEDITFHMTGDHHAAYLNEFMPNNKVAPAHNLLMRAVDPADKDTLKKFLELKTIAMPLVEALVSEFTPDITIMVGKSKKPPKE